MVLTADRYILDKEAVSDTTGTFHPYRYGDYGTQLVRGLFHKPPQTQNSISIQVAFLPQSFVLRQLASRYNYELLTPIKIDIESDEGVHIAHNASLNVYGAGETLSEAIEEFQSMLIDVFEELSVSEGILSNTLQQQLEDLRLILRRK